MFNKNKKASLMGNIVKAIPVLVMMAILFLIVGKIFGIGGEAIDSETCRESILLKAQSKILGHPFIDELRCQTNLLEFSKISELEIYGEIANHMYTCWHQFAEGEHDFLEDYDWGYGDNWCFVCSRIDFDDKIKTDYVVLEGLFDYLKTNPVPLRPEETFFEYLYGESSEIIGDQLTEQDFGLNISTQTPLYIGFFADKRSDWEELGVSGVVTLTIAGVLGCAVGGVIGFFGGVGAGAVPGCALGGKVGLAGGALSVGGNTLSKKTD